MLWTEERRNAALTQQNAPMRRMPAVTNAAFRAVAKGTESSGRHTWTVGKEGLFYVSHRYYPERSLERLEDCACKGKAETVMAQEREAVLKRWSGGGGGGSDPLFHLND